MAVALAATLLLALVALARIALWTDVFVAGETFYLDPDCYARMTRAERVVAHPGTVLRRHSFENYPDGTRPHTTAPFDYVIAGLAWAWAPFTARPLALAGAMVSPLLGLVGGCFLWWWAGRCRLPGRWLMLLFYAVSPILAHGTALGRPDHQSLLLLLVAVALAAEWAMFAAGDSGGRPWAVAAGAAWGLALWVSLYEPLVLFAATLALAAAADPRRFFRRDRLLAFAVTAAILALAWAVEGWRFTPPAGAAFGRWRLQVGELTPVPPLAPIRWAWLGWAWPALVALLLWRRAGRGAGLLLLALFALSITQARWGYWLALGFAMAIPVAAGVLPARARPLLLVGLVVSFWPLLQAWDVTLFGRAPDRADRRADNLALRQIAEFIVAGGGGPIVAPWWQSPALVFWTGSPGVAGSSHQSLPGIVDAAAILLAADPGDARALLTRRGVRWLVVAAPDRTEPLFSQLLGRPPPPESLGRTLFERPTWAPAGFEPVFANSRFKLFRVAVAPPASPPNVSG